MPFDRVRRARGARVAMPVAIALFGWRALAAEPEAATLVRGRQLLAERAAILGTQAGNSEGVARWRARELYRYLQVMARADLRQPEADRERALLIGLRALERERVEARTLQDELVAARGESARLEGAPPSATADASPNPSPTLSSGVPTLAAPIVAGVVVARFGLGRERSTGVWVNRSGVRLRGRGGDAVVAFGAGVVRRVEPSPAGGLALVVDHGGGWTSILAGLDSVTVQPGARLARGARVGRLGGASGTPSELVVELWRGRTPVDPSRYLAHR